MINLIIYVSVLLNILNIIIIITGGIKMNTILSKLSSLNSAISALQTRVGTGVVVQQADLDSVSTGIDSAISAINSIAVIPAAATETPAAPAV